jgi:hypothetical protein
MINSQDTKDKAMEKHLRAMLASWIEGKVVEITPKGGRWLSPWGSNRYMANAAGVAVLARESSPRHARQVQLFRGVATPLPWETMVSRS